MRKLLAFIITIAAFNSFATFETFTKTFDELVLPDTYGEFRLERSLYTESDSNHSELAPVVSHIMDSNFTTGLVAMKMDMMFEVDEVMNVFGKTYGDYYCYRLVQEDDSYDYDEKVCKAKLRNLVEAAFADKDVDQISLLNLEGDYYGDWHTIFFLLQNYKTKETMLVEFDILHEI